MVTHRQVFHDKNGLKNFSVKLCAYVNYFFYLC